MWVEGIGIFKHIGIHFINYLEMHLAGLLIFWILN